MVHVNVCSDCIDVLSWCKCVVPDSKTDHCLRDQVSKVCHISLAEFEGTISGEVHREGENEDPTVDTYVPSGALLWRLLTPYRLPVLCIKADSPILVFPC